MTEQWILATVCLLLVAIPALHRPRMALFNPASFVLLAVIWSVVLKLLYITLFYPEPPTQGITLIFVTETSTDFLASGLYVLVAGFAAYCAGYVAAGWKRRTDDVGDEGFAIERRAALTLLSAGLVVMAVSFVIYLAMSGNNPFAAPYSAKRFLPSLLGLESRFAYPPYYPFKLSTLVFQVSLVAAVIAFARSGQVSRKMLSFSLLTFLGALFLAHFANMRLVLIILIVQLVLVAVYFSGRKGLRVAALVVALGGVTMFSITYVHRGMSPFVEHRWWGTVLQETARSEGTAADAGEGDSAASSISPAGAARADVFLYRFLYKTFVGRYFFDIVKMGIVAEGFPEELPFLHGVSFFNTPLWPVEAPELAGGLRAVDVGPWISQHLFHIRLGSTTTGFAAELFVNFGYAGIVVGFLLLGALHRRLFERLSSRGSSLVKVACVVVLLPHVTLVLINTGFLAAFTRAVFDVGAIMGIWYATRFGARYRWTAAILGLPNPRG